MALFLEGTVENPFFSRPSGGVSVVPFKSGRTISRRDSIIVVKGLEHDDDDDDDG